MIVGRRLAVIDMDMIWMGYAVVFAKIAGSFGDVAIGAVLIHNNSIIGYGYNSSVARNDPTSHAEIIALRMGGNFLGNYRLLNTILYVTLEPCMMCIGAIIHARIYRLVYGAKNNKISWVYLWNKYICNNPFMINHYLIIKSGVLGQICSDEIINFFKNRRLL